MKKLLLLLALICLMTAAAAEDMIPTTALVDGLWVPVDADGVMIGHHGYQQMDEFVGDYAAVQDDTGLWGVIDRYNRLLIPCRYEELRNESIGVYRTGEGETLEAGAIARRWPANCVIVDVDPDTTMRSPSDAGEWVIAATYRATQAYPAKVEPHTANREQALFITPEDGDTLLRGASITAWPNATAAKAHADMSYYAHDESGQATVAGHAAHYHYNDAPGTLSLYIDTERGAALCVFLYLREDVRPGTAAMLAEAEQLLAGLTLPTGASHRFEDVWFCDEDYILVRQNDLYGLMDFDGNMILPCQWAEMSEPWRGLIGVKRPEDDMWGCIDLEGNVVLPFEWHYVDPTVDWNPETGEVSVMVWRDGKQGRYAADGSVLVPCEFGHVGQYGEEPWPYYADTDREGETRRYFVRTDRGMEERMESDFSWSWESRAIWQPPEGYTRHWQSMPEGLYLLTRQSDGRLFFARKDGSLLDETGFDEVGLFMWYESGGEDVAYAPVRRGDKWGYVDQTGALVIPCRYDGAKEMREDRAPVRIGSPEDGERFWIDPAGNRLYDYPWDGASAYNRGVALVKQDGLWGLIDREGSVLAGCRWEAVRDNAAMALSLPFAGAELMAVTVDGLMGFVNVKGEMVVPCQFEAENFRGSYLGELKNAQVRGDRAVVWYQGELLIFAADGTRIY